MKFADLIVTAPDDRPTPLMIATRPPVDAARNAPALSDISPPTPLSVTSTTTLTLPDTPDVAGPVPINTKPDAPDSA